MVRLTEEAARQVTAALEQRQAAGFALRVGLVGGGCRGFLYDLSFVETPDADDLVFESHGVKVIVNPQSYGVLKGMEIDYGPLRGGSGFLFRNPQAAGHCGCGASFGV
jgi:iron-sulfur cluster assembly protein